LQSIVAASWLTLSHNPPPIYQRGVEDDKA